jgi:hypothetical protein
MDAAYFTRAAGLRRLADSLGLAIVPCVFPVGRSSPMLANASDLAEALPVREAPFVVRGGVAVPVSDPPVAFAAQPDGADPGVRVGRGTASTGGRVPSRWWYALRVAPHRVYHVWWSIRTRGFTGRPLVRVLAGDRPLNTMGRLDVKADQDWTRYDLMFDSMDATSVRVLFGLWHPASGALEWRDWGIGEAGPVNVVRRGSAPFTLRDAGGRALVEGRDFAPVHDELLGNDPWRGEFRDWHEPPSIRARVADGTRLLGSWEHAAVVGRAQVSCCLSESLTFVRLADEARRVRALFGPGRYLMQFDEIRALGGDAACARTGRTPGQILAAAVRRCAAMLPGDTLYVWGDMFDPSQNAVRDYFLVRGDLAGSWEGLAERIGIFNWNAPAATRSLRFFSGRGHRQVIAGYYDGAPGDVRKWLDAARGVPGVEAVLYATWQGRYDDLEAFARACGH